MFGVMISSGIALIYIRWKQPPKALMMGNVIIPLTTKIIDEKPKEFLKIEHGYVIYDAEGDRFLKKSTTPDGLAAIVLYWGKEINPQTDLVHNLDGTYALEVSSHVQGVIDTCSLVACKAYKGKFITIADPYYGYYAELDFSNTIPIKNFMAYLFNPENEHTFKPPYVVQQGNQ
jgi:hypothetical protein